MRDRQEPCGQKDSVTGGWQIDLRKGDIRKRKPGEQAERRQVDREIRRYRHRVKGRDRDGQTLMERQRDTQKQADAPRQTGRHIPERQSEQGRWTEEYRGARAPNASGHPEMEQKPVGGGQAEPRIGGDRGPVGVPG